MGGSPKIFSKTVRVGDREIKSNVTQEMVDDLKALTSMDAVLREIERQEKRADRLAKLDCLNKLSEEQG